MPMAANRRTSISGMNRPELVSRERRVKSQLAIGHANRTRRRGVIASDYIFLPLEGLEETQEASCSILLCPTSRDAPRKLLTRRHYRHRDADLRAFPHARLD